MSRARPLVLVIEDEQRIAAIVMDYLRQGGFDALHAADGQQGLRMAEESLPDLVLLDVMLPILDGLSVCRQLRQKSAVPIIMASARVEELDRLLGLELGADDYVCKPYSPREVVARIRAVLRRAQTVSADDTDFAVIIDEAAQRAAIGGHALDLTRTEFKLLRLLSSRPGRVFSRAQILELAYDDEQDVSDRVIDSHVKNLRRKIAERAGDREVIRSVYGVGYRYET
jgi:two-component system response regulator BaeR